MWLGGVRNRFDSSVLRPNHRVLSTNIGRTKSLSCAGFVPLPSSGVSARASHRKLSGRVRLGRRLFLWRSVIWRHNIIQRCQQHARYCRPRPPDPLPYPSQLFSTITAAESNTPEKSLPAKLSDRHLPGFIFAPVYPGIIPLLANVVNPSATPTSSGPSRGPNSIACRGSRPSPKARKRRTNELAISFRNI